MLAISVHRLTYHSSLKPAIASDYFALAFYAAKARVAGWAISFLDLIKAIVSLEKMEPKTNVKHAA
jgi:hypothetical protein